MTETKKPLFLIIDFQNAYLPGQEWECSDINIATKNVQKIINSNLFDTIITSRFIAPNNPEGVWEDYNKKYEKINNDSYLNEYTDDIKRILSDNKYIDKIKSYDKSKYSSLSVPEILEACKKASFVVVSGITTGCCVLSTVMELIDTGIYTIIVKDATASSSPECKEAVWEVLKNLCPLHAKLMDTDLLIEEMKNR